MIFHPGRTKVYCYFDIWCVMCGGSQDSDAISSDWNCVAVWLSGLEISRSSRLMTDEMCVCWTEDERLLNKISHMSLAALYLFTESECQVYHQRSEI